MKSNNNIETSKDRGEATRIRLAEEKNDSEQVIINISPDIFEQLQSEFFQMQDKQQSCFAKMSNRLGR